MKSKFRIRGNVNAGAALRFVVLASVVSLALAVAAPTALAAKLVSNVIGDQVGTAPSGLGGLFNTARDVAVNNPAIADGNAAANGDFYVVDEQNQRIQRFNADGTFDRAWGRDVVTGGGTGFEICTVAADCKQGQTGSLGGELNIPQGLFVNQATGDVFVRERGNNRVQQFTADGTFLRAWGWDVIAATGPPPNSNGTGFEICDTTTVPANTPADCKAGVPGGNGGQLGTPSTSAASGVVIDPDPPHNVFVGDLGNRRVQEFTAGGAFVRTWGWDVVVTGQPGDVGTNNFEICSTTTLGVCKIAAASGADNGRFGTNQPAHLAMDGPTGLVYASDSNGSNRVMRFDSDEAAAADLLDPEINVTGVTATLSQATTGLEVDTQSGNLFVARTDTRAGVLELSSPSGAPALHAAHFGTNLNVPLTGSPSSNPGLQGIGFNPQTEELFVARTTASSGGHRIYVLDDDGAPSAIGTVSPASNVEATSASVAGSVNSNGPLPTSWRLEVSRNGTDWATVTSGQLPGGTSSVPVSGEATGLLPNTLYRVRVVTSKGFNNADVSSPELTFLTDAVAPEVAAVRADSVQDTTARLTARVNPHSTPTRYRFEYGVGDFQNVVPVPDAPVGAGPDFVFVSTGLTGLEPGTTYQFRVVATSDTEGATTSPAETFVTLSEPTDALDRGYELVSPADKLSGIGVGEWKEQIGLVGSMGIAAYERERFAAAGGKGSMLLDSAQGYANDWAFADRIDQLFGWIPHSPLTHAEIFSPFAKFLEISSANDDLSKVTWRTNNTMPQIFPETSEWRDHGTLGNGINPSFIGDWDGRWELFGPTAASQLAGTLTAARLCDAVFSGDGSHVACSTALATGGSNVAVIRGLAGPGDPTHAPAPADPGPEHPGFDDLVSGRSVYVADLSGGLADNFPDTGARSLVNVCTDGTEIPNVTGGGDLGAQACPDPLSGRDAHLISSRGATLNVGTAPGIADIRTSLTNVVSRDGSRIFFMSPDPLATGMNNGDIACTGTGPATLCAPQLYVRERNDDGSVTTRWISKAEAGLFGTQDASLTGQARFEGATPDGDKVFFRTNSPLSDDDPNGTGTAPVTTGTPNANSWDLYMYDLPNGPDGDPSTPDGDPAGGTLTRISAGPSGTGDCNGLQAASGLSRFTYAQGMLRFASDDGSRLYFVCSAPLIGAGAGPSDNIVSPSGTPITGDATNLYLYDAALPASERWRFVTRIPRAAAAGIDSCASTGVGLGNPLSAGSQFLDGAFNCVRGIHTGEFIAFWTAGRLTADDPDTSSADIYGYDAVSDELVRITAAQEGIGGSYACSPDVLTLQCNGDWGADYRDSPERLPKPNLGVATHSLVAGDRIAFFQSRSRLVPEDADDSYDVYQWRNGELSLLTVGSRDAFIKGSDRGGRNVYFATREALTWEDVDVVNDIYTARVGGGIPEPQPPSICAVLAGACQGGGALPDGPPTIDSAGPSDGNVVQGERPAVALGGLSARQRAAAAERGVLPVRVRSNTSGRVSVVARARIGKRPRTVGRGSSRLANPGVVTIRLQLSQAARDRLRSGRPLRVRISAAMDGARTRTATFRLLRTGK